ncbi:MAG: winged helix-turn-helix domain-containing protein [Candidatus Caldarchaeum sp.]|nr:winged helix-turn-helix domain-containing protein [Candidatus Caldarchaeum sp.]
MKKAKIVSGSMESDVLLLRPSALKLFSSPTVCKLVKMFESPNYVSHAAARLGISKQLASVHVRRLIKADVLREVGETERRGGRAKLYQAKALGVASIFSNHAWRRMSKSLDMPEKLSKFLNPFIENGELNGLVVVGSPLPHGPFRAVATDGHYGFQLGLFIGHFVEKSSDFSVRLDVDVKSEKLYTQNLMLLGGPGTNIITSMVNKNLPVKFMENNYWAGLVSAKQVYTGEFTGLVAKTPNPFNTEKTIIVLAGLRAVGTMATVIALTRYWNKLLTHYEGQNSWAAVVEGLDLDADGKIDAVEILETV